jgi:hypothetical protein
VSSAPKALSEAHICSPSTHDPWSSPDFPSTDSFVLKYSRGVTRVHELPFLNYPTSRIGPLDQYVGVARLWDCQLLISIGTKVT